MSQGDINREEAVPLPLDGQHSPVDDNTPVSLCDIHLGDVHSLLKNANLTFDGCLLLLDIITSDLIDPNQFDLIRTTHSELPRDNPGFSIKRSSQEHPGGAHPRDSHPLAREALRATVCILEKHSAYHGDLPVCAFSSSCASPLTTTATRSPTFATNSFFNKTLQFEQDEYRTQVDNLLHNATVGLGDAGFGLGSSSEGPTAPATFVG